jgi:capsular polysaccharide biosynthesis protein
VFTISLRNVTLMGYRSILSREGFLANDVGHLTTDDARSFAKTLGRFEEMAELVPVGDGVFSRVRNGQPETHLEGPVVLLTSAEPGNFGSFMYRDLIKLVNLIRVPENWRFLIHIPQKAYEQFLELAGVPIERVIRHDFRTIYTIDQAIIPGLRNPLALADPQTRSFYDGLRAKCDTGERGRRLYISRLSVSGARPWGRVMLNEAELIARLRLLGFDIIEPQYLTAAEQIATFASADLVVGPSGSGMFNAIFCRPGTKLIDIESEPHWVLPHSCLFSSAGLQYGIFEGRAENRDWSVHHKQWRVNIEALLARIAVFAPRELTLQDDVKPRGADGLSCPHLTPRRTATRNDSTLDQIGLKWGTDKSSAHHDYLRFYENFFFPFRGEPITILEVGVFNGASLKTWEEYFPAARVVGVDILPECKRYQRGRVLIELIDQSNIEELTHLAAKCGPFDIVIDDGSHFWEHQLTSLRALFPFLKNEGFYIVEDLHTNYGSMQKDYRGAATSTCMDYLKRWVDLCVADDQLPLETLGDAFLRTYGRAIAYMTFRRRACLIKKRYIQQDRNPDFGQPLAQATPEHVMSAGLFAHLSLRGDVFGPTGFVNLDGEKYTFQGIKIYCEEAMLEYRVRWTLDDWSEWVNNGEFIGSVGQARELTGVAVRVRGNSTGRHYVRVLGRFAHTQHVVMAFDGEDCTTTGGEVLCGLQVQVAAR